MAETVTNLKVRFGADTKQFKQDLDQAKVATEKFSSSAKSAFSDFAKVFGVNIDGISSGLSSAKNSLSLFSLGLKSSAAGASVFSAAMKIVKLALISTGLGAIVVVLGSLIAYFTRFSEGSKVVKVAMAGIGAVINVIMDRVATFGKAMFQIFTGDFSGAAKSLEATFTGITEEISKEFDLARKLKAEILSLSKASKVFEAEREAGQTKILELREKTKNIDLAPSERLKAVKEANEIEAKLAEKSLDLAEKEQAAALNQIDAKTGKLALDQKGLELIEKIKNGTISASDAQKEFNTMAISSADLSGQFSSLIEKIVNREKEQQSIIQTRLRLQKAENTLRKEILSQEIEGIKAVAELKEQQAKDEKKSLVDRTNLMLESSLLQQKALRLEFDSNNISKEKFIAELDKLAIETEGKIKDIREKLNPKMEVLAKVQLEFKTNKKGNLEIDQHLKAPEVIPLQIDKLQTSAAKIKTTFGDLKTEVMDFTQVFNDSMNSAAVGFGESIGNMLAGTGGLKDLGVIVGQTLGDMAIQVGKIAIGTGIAALGIKKALQTLNPAVAIAGGIALIALGSWVKSSLSSAMSGGSSGSFSAASSGGGDTGTGSLSSPSNLRSAPLTINIVGTLRAQGKELVAVIDKANQRTAITT